jgi:uncharacterized protein affecting Mg2+/Co2+ transport
VKKKIMSSLLAIAENQDVFQRHLLAYLSINEFVRLQSLSKSFWPPINHETCWKILCQRDFGVYKKAAPEYNPHTKSFDNLREHKNYKELYRQWSKWQQQTCYGIEPHHMIQAIGIWSRCKTALRQQDLTKILKSLKPPPSREFFERAAGNLPSSLLAFYAIHAGQCTLTPRSPDDDFFAGLFGSYSCYNAFYSMRLMHVSESVHEWVTPTSVVVGMNLGNPRTFLVLDFSNNEGPDGSMYFGYQVNTRHLVCRGGILSYFERYTERLERKIYQPSIIHPDSPSSLGLCLFPETGDMVSVAVSNGVEVRASARWFPERAHGAMNFGYSIRIGLAASGSDEGAVSCQLVDRNWEFHYEDGTINRVQGEGAIGKQPILFRRDDGTSGFVDMGPAGTGETNLNATFAYQSQSGPVPGTSSNDVTKSTSAYVRGTFSFRPGSIDAPTGPLFVVTVAEFPLRVTLPFY